MTPLGETLTVGEMMHFTRCWGGSSEDEKALYTQTYNRCYSENEIVISDHFYTGSVNYEFYWFETTQLNPLQFYHRYQASIFGAGPVNRATDEDVENFKCNQDFVEQPMDANPIIWKTTLCARAYKDYPGLFDLVFVSASVNMEDKGLVSHFALAGVTREMGEKFSKRFMEHVIWKSW